MLLFMFVNSTIAYLGAIVNKKAPEGAFLFLPIPEKNKQTIPD
jgi:hypothetical protein